METGHSGTQKFQSVSHKGVSMIDPVSNTKTSESLQPLLDKLERAKFTGELRLRWESGQVASA